MQHGLLHFSVPSVTTPCHQPVAPHPAAVAPHHLHCSCAQTPEARASQGQASSSASAPQPAGPSTPPQPHLAPADAAPPPRTCAAPGCTATRGLKRCAGCGVVRYCSTACSYADWQEHRPECRRLRAAVAETPAGGAAEAAPQQ